MSTPGHVPPPSAVTATVLDHLRGTKPWVRFISVLGFICAALLVLVGLFMMAIGGMGSAIPGMEKLGKGFGVLLGGLYFLAALVYVFFSIPLYRYASAIQSMVQSRSTGALEQALAHQRSFWRRVGITTLVLLCIYVAAIGLVFVAGFMGALMKH